MTDRDDEGEEGRGRAVPSGRWARRARIGALGARLAGGAAARSLGSAARGRRLDVSQRLLDPKGAARLAGELSRLRGAALKLGQLVSMDAGELVPSELAPILERMRDQADPMPPRQLRRVLDAAWGRGWLSRFERFQVRPVAAASIGQVHRATTRDGRELAVKVRYPGVDASIDSDVDSLAALIRLSGQARGRADFNVFVEAAKAQLHAEADYACEAENLRRYAGLVAEDERFAVPALHDDFAGEGVIAMDWMAGDAIERLDDAFQTTRDTVAERLVALFLDEILHFGVTQSDPNFANFRYDAATDRVVLLDFGSVVEIPAGLSAAYRVLLKAALDSDREGLRAGAVAAGFLDADTPESLAEAAVDAMITAAEPLHADGVYDFSHGDLARRLRDQGWALRSAAARLPTPPIAAIHLQRKAAGLLLLCRRLGARIPVRDIALAALTR